MSLHSATVERFLQGITGTQAVLAKALEHCAQTGAAADDLLDRRIAPDMLPFSFQIRAMRQHSWGAVQAAKDGLFTPPSRDPMTRIEEAQAALEEALVGLQAFTPADAEALIGRTLIFRHPRRPIDQQFLAEEFLLSFSLPNFLFHAVTAYNLLRASGAPIGKADYLGPLKGAPVKA